MKIEPELEEKGLLAYEQARAYEQLQRRGLPLIYGGFLFILMGFGFAAWQLGWPVIAAGCLGAGILFAIFTWANARRLRALYARNLIFLAGLEAKYGEELPWLEVERHLAALAKIQAEEKGAS